MAQQHNHDIYHVTPFSTYLKVYFTLLAFTLLTVGMAQPVVLNVIGRLGVVVAMTIATVKAGMVVWYFMHQGHEGKMNRAIFGAGFIFLFIFWFFCFIDWASRTSIFEHNKFNPPAQEGSEVAH